MSNTYIINNDDDDVDVYTNDIYRYKMLRNVSKYEYIDFDKWSVNVHSESGPLEENETCYLIIDCIYHDAFAHWVYESAIYLLLYTQLKEIYPNIKLHLKSNKSYKKLFCELFNIKIDDISYELLQTNKCIFPLPISSLNIKHMSMEYKTHIDRFIHHIQLYMNTNHSIRILLLPRQMKENYKDNDRTYNTSDIEFHVKNDNINKILHTDTIENLKEQINIVSMSKNIILTSGSPYFVNGIFCKHSNIIVLDNIIANQIKHFNKIKYIHSLILDTNNVTILPNKGNRFTYDSVRKYLI